MAELENKERTLKESWFAGLKAEFNKIIWPTKESLAKQTTAVVVVSVIVGLIIALMDSIIQYGINILVNL